MQWPRFLKRQLAEVTIDPAIARFTENLTGSGFSPRFFDRLWVANRCCQLNSQMISCMPLRFFGTSAEPAWVANPDPAWFPNGVGDAVFAATWDMYAWGDAFIYVTSRYANGFPSAWTVLPASSMNVQKDGKGGKTYRAGQTLLNPDDVVQVTRDPHGGLRGTSALQSFASHLWAAEAAGETGRAMMTNPNPNAVLKSMRKLTAEQAEQIQAQWAARTGVRSGAPAVLDPGIEFQQLAFSPKDLLLLDAQQFEAKTVAAAFGVPPVMLNMSMEGGLLYQSPQMLYEIWWRGELRPASLRLSQALSAQMLPNGSWVEFDARDVLAPTFTDLVTAWDKMLAANVVSIDEYRAAVLRLPSRASGDAIGELTQPSVADSNNVQPLRPAQQQLNQEVRK